jgi:hypothetical protein
MADLDEELERERAELIKELEGLSEFRRGSVNVVFRKCGKPGCACAKAGHPGHGPLTTLTYSEHGKTKTRGLSGGVIAMVREQVANRAGFLAWHGKWQDWNERACEHRVREALSGEAVPQEKKRRTSSSRKPAAKSGGSFDVS